MSARPVVFGNQGLELPQSADPAGPVLKICTSGPQEGMAVVALLLAAATSYRAVCLHYAAQPRLFELEPRISPITLVSRAGSVASPVGRYISLDLEDFQ